MSSIFVQIASYRDPELVPTVLDCIANAKYPKRLHFCIGWQHSGDEDISELYNVPNMTIVEVQASQSQGACWMRSKIQAEYTDQTYTLQLDSHHRFVKDWDVKLIEMYKKQKALGFNPLFTSYLPSYQPKNEPNGRLNECWQVNYDRFLPEGVIFLRPSLIKNWEGYNGDPVFAKALSAHFIFTKGKWCKEVLYDPNIYFHGEEISLAARSYTHGYDLFHPTQVIVWHQYTREGAKKHWDDHKSWDKRNSESYYRVKTLFGTDLNEPVNLGEYGFGKKRTLAQFERYAGVRFKDRVFHADSIEEKLPPAQRTDLTKFDPEYEQGLRKWYKHCIDIYKPDVPELDYDFWCCVFKDENDKDMYRKDLDANEINYLMHQEPNDKFLHIWRDFYIDQRPYKWTIWPHSKSKGWETKIIENKINYA